MLIACWSPKGGSGTTVVSAALALLLARTSPEGAVVADLAGDVPAVLGMEHPGGPGLLEWLSAGDDVPDDALGRIEVRAAPGLSLLALTDEPRLGAGAETSLEPRGEALAVALAADPRPVVADCGPAASGAQLALAAGATLSLLVLRPCYLALRRALAAPLRPAGIVLLAESGRALLRDDVEHVLGVPVRAEVDVEPAIARAVDAGLLTARLPRPLERALGRALVFEGRAA